MANLFRLFKGTSLLIDLMAWPYLVTSVSSNAPELREEDIEASYEHGVRKVYARYSNPKEEVTIFVAGDTAQQANDNAETLERVVNDCIQALNDFGETIYVRYQPDGVDVVYQSKVITMSWVSGVNRMAESHDWLLASSVHPNAEFVTVTLTFERMFYWEDTNDISLPLTNSNGTNVTTGLDVQNHDGGAAGEDNWVNINAADVKGSLPSVLTLEMENRHASHVYADVHVAHNAFYDPLNFPHWIEAEAATLNSGASIVNNAVYSGSSAVQITKTAGEYYMMYWTLGSGVLLRARARWFKILGFIYSTNSTTYAKISLSMNQLTRVAESPWVRCDLGIIDFGNFKIPPVDLGSSVTPKWWILELRVKSTTGSSIVLDNISLMPCAEPDGYCVFKRVAYGIGPNEKLIGDGRRELVYGLEPAGYTNQAAVLHEILGSYLHVVPGVDQRLIFSWQLNTGSLYKDDVLRVVAKYRERRLRV